MADLAQFACWTSELLTVDPQSICAVVDPWRVAEMGAELAVPTDSPSGGNPYDLNQLDREQFRLLMEQNGIESPEQWPAAEPFDQTA